jgi:hypothetical protein
MEYDFVASLMYCHTGKIFARFKLDRDNRFMKIVTKWKRFVTL